jgi:hypothetical protein
MGTRKSDKHQLLTWTCTNQTTSWLLRSWNTLVHGQATSKHGFTRLTMTQTYGKPSPSSLYYILCLVTGWAPNAILSWNSQVGVSKFPQLSLLRLWGPITLRAYLWLRWVVKKSFSPHRDLSNGMSHATYTQRNRGDFRLLVVGSQTANLTPDPSFAHNLCLKCSNGSCKPILNI